MLCGCKKDFLEAKPSTRLVTPKTLEDFRAMLENVDNLNRATPGLLQMASDDYIFISNAFWQGTIFNAERNSYIWATDLYEDQRGIKDWSVGFSAIFICNNVLEGLKNIAVNAENQKEWNNIKGRALFMRAYVLYDLVRSFAPVYDINTSTTALGMPLRLTPGIDEIKPRSTVEQTYNRIFTDLTEATGLLMPEMEINYKQRPSKVAAMALLSRIYLSMCRYDKAEEYADLTLNLYRTLIDYNTIDVSEKHPFSMNNAETILNTTVINNYYSIILNLDLNEAITINPELYDLYEVNDLRKDIYFATNLRTGFLYKKFSYAGPVGVPFTGLATDEIFLIKAECLARKNKVSDALSVLNSLLINRYKTGTFIPINAIDPADALNKVLLERRKELVWRSLRWSDLKRLNKEGANITLKRKINGQDYILPPNDPKYVFPIPKEETERSGN